MWERGCGPSGSECIWSDYSVSRIKPCSNIRSQAGKKLWINLLQSFRVNLYNFQTSRPRSCVSLYFWILMFINSSVAVYLFSLWLVVLWEYYFDDVVRNALCTEIIHNILPFLNRIQWSTKPVLFHRSLQMLFYRVWKLLHNQWALRHTFVTIR